MRIGFLSVMQRYGTYVAEQLYATPDRAGPALLEPGQIAADIGALRVAVDFCVVLVHWGRNYKPLTRLQRQLARGLRDAGADLIVGHHPHIPQPMEVLDGVPVLYSLGNAAFGTPGRYHSERPPYGLIVIADVEVHRVLGVELRLIHVDNAMVEYQPQPATEPKAIAYLNTLYPADLART
jgi:poly-gamma-glutamate capsule biosynthesis protein CapA/YwtB (metallophosphatase superfamily)